ncbi:MAG: hypothetical protein L0196_09590 [candidate division Zixibacteria bacterium]|nr:hypothetical protein [candidate division Zixibacteria bacterium]
MDPTPWFDDPNRFGALFGAIVGGGGGTLGGLLGALAGKLAPRGKGRQIVVGGFVLFISVGAVLLAAGIYALVSGQPYAIFYPLLLCGGIFCAVMGGLLPLVLKRYREAEKQLSSPNFGEKT